MSNANAMARGIAVRQPWAGLIVLGFKDVENRVWSTKHRGTVYIHACQKVDEDAFLWLHHKYPTLADHPAMRVTGKIIGRVQLVDCSAERNGSIWHKDGMIGWYLDQPERLVDPVPYSGNQGLLNIDRNLLEGCAYYETMPVQHNPFQGDAT